MNLTDLEMEFAVGHYGEIKMRLWKMVLPIFIFVGLAGNSITVLVLLSSFKKMSSTAIYLMALTLSTTVILLTGPLRNWILSVWKTDIRSLSDAGCKVQLYLTYAGLHISSWLLVAVTWERTLIVMYPMKAREICTARNAAVVISGICVIIFAIDLVVPVMITLHGVKNTFCAPKNKEWLHFRDNIYKWIDFMLLFAGPIVFLLAGNVIIFLKLQVQRKKRKKMCTFGKQTTRNGQGHASLLVVALSVIYLVTMTPTYVFRLYLVHWLNQIVQKFQWDPHGASEEFQFARLLQSILYMFSYLNVTFNFALYVFSGLRFRNDLLAILICKKRSLAPEILDPIALKIWTIDGQC